MSRIIKIIFKNKYRNKKLFPRQFSKYAPVLSFLLLGLFIFSCNGDSDDDIPKSCTGTANYTVTFVSTWTASTHPVDFPSNPHFSGLIGGVHNGNIMFWDEGKIASLGMESMAETGSKTDLMNEVEAAITAGNASSVISGGGINPSPGSVSTQFEVSAEYPLVTLVSMIAPSPDWFVGVYNLSLCKNGEWIDTISIDLFPYDAGSDSGATYTAADDDTNPKENISKLTTGVFLVNNTVPKLGTFTFVKMGN